MADAGKVAILPRGLWSAETVYEPLDLVYYNNNSFVALKESVGVTPVDGDTWMLSLSGISQETIDAILNGTQQVGDSKELGGETAEAWQGKINTVSLNARQSISKGFTKKGWYRIATYTNLHGAFILVLNNNYSSGGSDTIVLLYSGVHEMGEFNLLKSKSASNTQIFTDIRIVKTDIGYAIDVYYNRDGTNMCYIGLQRLNRPWSLVESITAVETNPEETDIALNYNIQKNAKLVLNTEFEKEIAKYLPLTGGGVINGFTQVHHQGNIPFSVANSEGVPAYIAYNGLNGLLGMLGFGDANQPTFYESDGQTSHLLLHTGNSAKVHIQSTAPTEGLWVDTANKKVKALIDGAWTAMA